jgi:hypothetical protein
MSLSRADVRAVLDIYLARMDHPGSGADRQHLHCDGDLPRAGIEGADSRSERDQKELADKSRHEQANIEAELLDLYLDGTTAIAEWEARFDDLVAGCRKRMREVAILEFDRDETPACASTGRLSS